jgi:tRNA(Ile)-lysidine synthase
LLKDPWFFQGDADLLRFPLHLRPWQPGDAMQPLGMKGHKKISDLLNEAQWPVVHRARLMVLLSEGEIVWAAGLRIADWVKVGPDTKNVLQIQLTERI